MSEPPHVSPAFFSDRPFPDLIALDIDDTLVPHLGTVTEGVVEAIARAREAGITVALATGRTLSTTAPVGRAAGIDGWAVCSNGAVLATIEPETIIDTRPFDPRPVLDQLVKLVPNAVFAVEDIHGVFHTTRMFGAGALGLSIREVPFEHLLADPVTRIVVRSDAHAETGFDEIAAQMGLHTVNFGLAKVAWMDIGPQGVNKSTMLAELCTRLDLNPARSLVVGDSWNDIEMLQWAGTGVAMGTAPDGVRRVADAITSPEPGQGVVEVIDALLSSH